MLAVEGLQLGRVEIEELQLEGALPRFGQHRHLVGGARVQVQRRVRAGIGPGRVAREQEAVVQLPVLPADRQPRRALLFRLRPQHAAIDLLPHRLGARVGAEQVLAGGAGGHARQLAKEVQVGQRKARGAGDAELDHRLAPGGAARAGRVERDRALRGVGGCAGEPGVVVAVQAGPDVELQPQQRIAAFVQHRQATALAVDEPAAHHGLRFGRERGRDHQHDAARPLAGIDRIADVAQAGQRIQCGHHLLGQRLVEGTRAQPARLLLDAVAHVAVALGRAGAAIQVEEQQVHRIAGELLRRQRRAHHAGHRRIGHRGARRALHRLRRGPCRERGQAQRHAEPAEPGRAGHQSAVGILLL